LKNEAREQASHPFETETQHPTQTVGGAPRTRHVRIGGRFSLVVGEYFHSRGDALFYMRFDPDIPILRRSLTAWVIFAQGIR